MWARWYRAKPLPIPTPASTALSFPRAAAPTLAIWPTPLEPSHAVERFATFSQVLSTVTPAFDRASERRLPKSSQRWSQFCAAQGLDQNTTFLLSSSICSANRRTVLLPLPHFPNTPSRADQAAV